MFTFLDLLIVVVMALAAAGLLTLALMFLIKNKTAQRVCLYIMAALGVYIGTVGFRINWLGFEIQAGLAVAMALVCVAAPVIAWIKKDNQQVFLLSRIATAAALVVGFANAFLV